MDTHTPAPDPYAALLDAQRAWHEAAVRLVRAGAAVQFLQAQREHFAATPSSALESADMRGVAYIVGSLGIVDELLEVAHAEMEGARIAEEAAREVREWAARRIESLGELES